MKYLILIFILCCHSCSLTESTAKQRKVPNLLTQSHVEVLGIAQDAGFPQAACQKVCCAKVWAGEVERAMVSCLGLFQYDTKKAWLFDATPDFKDQLNVIEEKGYELAGIFITHAHIGHYTGLMHLGHEVMGAHDLPVYVMPRMKSFLEENGPWGQLVSKKNIRLVTLQADSTLQLTNEFAITPIRVPHRDEYSETVGYQIKGDSKSALFIPDIDKWHLWDRDIKSELTKVDYAFLDGTFYANGEIPGRDMSQIPHPFVEESMDLFKDLPVDEKSKIQFIHFNHTNPVLDENSTARSELVENGFAIANGIYTLN